MPLSVGTRLGPYEIVAPLGAGGMGEVYRARDTRLGRDVAVKVLAQHLSSNAEVRTRFEREAKTVSSLNDPHICTLHDIGRQGDIDYLVMELVEGETLADRLTRGALPIAEVLRLGAQIASALDRAHRAGIVHRDLKPGNVMLAKGGAKLMDFGLARATGMAGPSDTAGGAATTALAQSPIMTSPLTSEGTIVGTFQYMSPEQLEGREADARSDLWALGCVLYEMVTGRRAFEGKSQASLIGSIMNAEPPPISSVVAMAPPGLDRLVRRCLAKDPEDRWQNARDIAHELQWIGSESGSQAGAPLVSTPPSGAKHAVAAAAGRARAVLAWAVLATIALVVTLAMTSARERDHSSVAPAPIEFTLEPPPGCTFPLPADPVLSPDGRTVACVVRDSLGIKLAVRPLERAEFRILPGSEAGWLPFWSPDGRWIAFFSDSKLRKLSLDGNTSVALADASDGRGGVWLADGTILFVPTASGCVYSIPAAGGNAVPVTTLDSGREEVGHRYPSLIQGGPHFLYVAFGKNGEKWLCVGDVASGPSRVLRETETAASWAGPGWILGVDHRRVMAQRFDERKLEVSGPLVEIAQCGGIPKYGHANLAAAANTVVYQWPRRRKARLRWVDADGNSIGERTREFESPVEVVLAPDQQQVAMTLAVDNDLWLLDLEQPVPKRLTFFDAPQYNGLQLMTWSPDSRRIAYTLNTGAGGETIHIISSETSADTILFTAPGFFARAQSWTNDGRQLIALCSNSEGNLDIWTIPIDDPKAASCFLETPEYEFSCTVSPNGSWLACLVAAQEERQLRIYSMQTPGVRYQVVLEANLNNFRPAWSDDGRTIVVCDRNGHVLAIPVQFEGGFRQGVPRVLHTMPPHANLVAVTPDLRRFLVMEVEPQSNPGPLCVLMGWPQRMGTP